MATNRISIGAIRREQIVDAAVAVIAEKGLPSLSLSEIEKKVGMSRGQLTYYFKAKEDILLAVFDRTVEMMCQRQCDLEWRNDAFPFDQIRWIDMVAKILALVMQKPPAHPEFGALQYTFLSQIGHRADFRRRLAQLYEEWRSHGTRHLSHNLAKDPPARKVSPRAVATLVQAIFHGMAMQTLVDPEAFDAEETARLCLDMLQSYLWPDKSGETEFRDGAFPNGSLGTRTPARRASEGKAPSTNDATLARRASEGETPRTRTDSKKNGRLSSNNVKANRTNGRAVSRGVQHERIGE
ncbi:MAG: TetR/AcrR family transcriptional regulator [Gemmataceae bacterium]|nr:TetR/AcrR family transcriptional regulator [Gemmataceae bacterium]MCI0742754.1 TetR/AcrR family transcriptional regulator [Gemmataceae bacterium]